MAERSPAKRVYTRISNASRSLCGKNWMHSKKMPSGNPANNCDQGLYKQSVEELNKMKKIVSALVGVMAGLLMVYAGMIVFQVFQQRKGFSSVPGFAVMGMLVNLMAVNGRNLRRFNQELKKR